MDHEFWRPLVSSLVTLLVTSLFLYFAARFVLGRSSLFAALGTALLGTFLAGIVMGFAGQEFDIPEWAIIVIGIAVWSLVAAFFFRARLVQGAIIGLVAAVLWILVRWIIGML